MTTHQDTNTERNCRVQERYDELMQAGKHGHYESMFRVVREEVDAALSSRDEAAQQPQGSSAEDVRELSKWLNEEVSAPINRQALARVLAVQQPQGQAVSDERVEELAAQFDISVSAVRAILSLRDKSVVKESLTTERVPLSDERLDYMMREAFEKAYCAYYPVTAQTNRDVFERDSLGDYIRVNVQSGWTMWQAALTQPQAQQPQERDPSGIYQMYGAFVACVAGARIPGTYQSWLGARLALALPDDVLIDLLNKAAPNDISDKAVFSAYQEHQKTQAQQAAAVPTGFKLVPVEPTEEMIVDGMQADVLGRPSIDDDSHVLSIFKAMLEAAPPAPVLPLSVEQIGELWDGHTVNVFDKVGINPVVFARAIEAAHGITAKERAMGIDFDRLANLIEDAAIRYAGGCPTDFRPTAKEIASIVLYEAERAFSDHDKTGRQWVKGSLWDTLTNEGCARIRALAKGVR